MGRPQKRVRQLVSLVFLYPARLPLSCSSTSILLVYLYPIRSLVYSIRLPISSLTQLPHSSTSILPYSFTVYPTRLPLFSPTCLPLLPYSPPSYSPLLSIDSSFRFPFEVVL